MIRAPLLRIVQARAPTTVVIGALACLLLAVPSTTRAAPPEDASANEDRETELIRIRVKPKNRKLSTRLEAELGTLGYAIEPVGVAKSGALRAALLDHLDGATAAIEIVVAKGRVEIWVADAATDKAVMRRHDLREQPEMREPRTLAIAAVELLRISRLEAAESGDPTLAPAIQVTEGERPPDEPDPDPVDLPLTGALSLAPIFGGSAGGPGLVTQLEIAGRWAPMYRRFALRAHVWIPTYGNLVESDQGSARVFLAMAFVEPQLRLPGGAPWFHPELGLGLGGAIVSISSKANEGFRSRSDLLGGFAGHGHVGLGFELSRRVWIRADGYVGIIQPQPRVVFVEDVVARFGLPFGSGSVGLEIWL